MPVIFSSATGMDVDDFLDKYDVRNKNIVYCISNKLKSDRHRYKIGKSVDGHSRLQAYRRAYGKSSRTDAHAGALVHRVETVAPRPEHAQGPPLVDYKEKAIKQYLGPPVRFRGSEFFEATYAKMVKAFESAPKSVQYKDKRETDRVPMCPKTCRKRTDGQKTEVVD